MYIRCISAALFWLCVIVPAQATDKASSFAGVGKQLEEINVKIQSLNKRNLEREGELGKIQLKLRSSDKLIESSTKELKRLQRKIRSTQASLRKLKGEKTSQITKLQQHQARLAEQLRALHRNGELFRLQGLARSQPLHQYLRNQTYFRYLQQARGKKIMEIRRRQVRLQKTEQAFTTQLQTLKQLNTQAQLKTDNLAKQRKDRKRALTKLNKSLKSTKKELADLDLNRKELNELIERLRFVKAHPEGKNGKAAFSRLRGKLQWPVAGRVTKSASAPGVTIHAQEGLDVRAVSAGRVVFADWMRGLGLLTIVDHGNGYMSLYGNNQSLSKKPGEWVETGAVISFTGRSGGKLKSGLYFEIRKNAKPLDPRKWCRSS